MAEVAQANTFDEASKYDEYFVSDKDPAYMYKWCNSRERVMMQRVHQGYEVVTDPEKVPEAVAQIQKMNGVDPALNGGVRRRGDLVLMRIRKDVHARTVAGPINRARDRQSASLDTMVQQANEQAVRTMKKAGLQPSKGGAIVFQDTAEPFKQ